MTLRIAMWSGPRNISTAMMRSWSSRPDTAVTDEPFYGYYLRERSDVDHPGRDEVIGSMETDWRKVVATLLGPVPGNKPIWYQKHMTHHILPGMERSWILSGSLTNCFLIRDPREVLISLAKVTPNPTLADTGIPQQLELFHAECDRLGHSPPVIDPRDVLTNPRAALASLCRALGIPFLDSMLCWDRGPRPTDGVWGKHWYAAVEQSTGFGPYRERREHVPAHLRAVESEARAIYNQLRAHALH